MDCRKLTEKENMALKESCGRGKKALSHPRKQVFKAFGGQPVEQDELPFMATLRYSRGELMEMCGGSLISPYHVLTAAHCVMQFNFDELCNNRSKRKTADLKFNNNLKDWKIYIGSSCPIPELCMKPRKVSKFFYLRDYHPCNQGSDLAIFHLKKKVLPEEAVPICIAERDEEVNVLVYSAGTGFDPEKGEDEEQDHELQKVSLFRAKEFDDQIAVVDKESSLCGVRAIIFNYGLNRSLREKMLKDDTAVESANMLKNGVIFIN
ncbi:trypsin [Ancylostoma caninum]|uniref:Trypsin n=1 Tax=Ancylostoma caninum TaxID=29170 RepID=A0A368GX91_ANCCA|nr:trypsin [Ancylostoma caninum]